MSFISLLFLLYLYRISAKEPCVFSLVQGMRAAEQAAEPLWARKRGMPWPKAAAFRCPVRGYHSNALLLGGVRRATGKKTGQAALCGEPCGSERHAVHCPHLGPALGCRADAAPAACRCHAYKPCGHPGMGDGPVEHRAGRGRRAGGLFLCARIGERQPNGRQGVACFAARRHHVAFAARLFWASAWR